MPAQEEVKKIDLQSWWEVDGNTRRRRSIAEAKTLERSNQMRKVRVEALAAAVRESPKRETTAEAVH
jgi:hypothetical protein